MTQQSTSTTLASAPEPVLSGFARLYAAFWGQSHLPSPVLELCRLRLAQLHGATVHFKHEEFEIEPAKKSALGRAESQEVFGAGEKACMAFTEVYAMDVQSISDELAEAVKANYGDAGLVTLIEALGIFDGLIRVDLLWGESA